MKLVTRIAFNLLAVFVIVQSAQASDKRVIDSVVATVDGEPITWSDVVNLIPGQKPADLAAAKQDALFHSTMEAIITEKLLSLEATTRKINVGDAELDTYVNSVAERNNLTTEQFTDALKKEGKTIEQFRRSMKLEILKTKLANALMQDGGGVTDQEVEEYFEKYYGNADSRAMQVRLKQILVASDGKEAAEVNTRCQSVVEELKAGTDFAELAKKYSDAPEASSGGTLTVMSEKDLNPTIFGAIMTLSEGEYSEPVNSTLGCHVFFLEDRFSADENTDQVKEDIRKQLDRQKMDEKFQVFFVTDIYKNHSVERKI